LLSFHDSLRSPINRTPIAVQLPLLPSLLLTHFTLLRWSSPASMTTTFDRLPSSVLTFPHLLVVRDAGRLLSPSHSLANSLAKSSFRSSFADLSSSLIQDFFSFLHLPNVRMPSKHFVGKDSFESHSNRVPFPNFFGKNNFCSFLTRSNYSTETLPCTETEEKDKFSLSLSLFDFHSCALFR
jgi:hypothetical protein